MKEARLERKKLRKAAKPRRVAGVQVRSGVKAGPCERPGRPGRPGKFGRRLG